MPKQNCSKLLTVPHCTIHHGPVSGKISSLEMNLSPTNTLAIIVPSMLTSGLKIFQEIGPIPRHTGVKTKMVY